jgi:hypothetical protein
VQVVFECGHDADPAGPVFAKYLLYSNGTELSTSFTTSITADALVNCGDTKSPTVWHQGSSTDVTSGGAPTAERRNRAVRQKAHIRLARQINSPKSAAQKTVVRQQ